MTKSKEVKGAPNLKIMSTRVASHLVLTCMSCVFVMGMDVYYKGQYDRLVQVKSYPGHLSASS